MKSNPSLPRWFSKRSSGSLLHLSSLPGSYGIGNLGVDARAFVDFLARSEIRFWQTCPVGPTGYGDSPYQVFSSFAGNPYFIDWDPLVAAGLIDEAELSSLRELPAHEVDYGRLYQEFLPCARLAFSRFSQGKDRLHTLYGELESFSQENESWLTSYASFKVLKEREDGKPWWNWSETSRKADSSLLSEIRGHEDFAFHVFLQYVFWGQWKSLRAYANGRNVSLLGDLPIYAAPDSPRFGRGLISFSFLRIPVFPMLLACPLIILMKTVSIGGTLFTTGNATKQKITPGGWIDWPFNLSFSMS